MSPPRGATNNDLPEHLGRTDDFPAFSTPTRVGLMITDIDMSPIGRDPDFQVDFLPCVANVPPWLRKPTERKWRENPLLIVKFVDDGINAGVVNMKEVPLMSLGNENRKETKAEKTGRLLEHIRMRAEAKGMKVNESKTGLMCVSAAKSFQAKVSLSFNGQAVLPNFKSLVSHWTTTVVSTPMLGSLRKPGR